MKLGSLFPSTKTLADTVAKAPKLTPTPAVSPAAPKNIHRPGEFKVDWPKVRTQQVKDYKAITTIAELRAYVKRCTETGLGGFDYETGPSPEAVGYFEALLDTYGYQLNEARQADDKAEVKRLEGLIEDTTERYERCPLDPHFAEICAVSFSAAPDEARAVFISLQPGKRTFEPGLSREEARRLVFDLIEEAFFHSPSITKVAFNLSFETKHSAALKKYILPPVADPLVMWVRLLQVVAPHKIKDEKKPTRGWGLKPTVKHIFGVEMGDFRTLLNKHGVRFFNQLSADAADALIYSCEDSDYAVQHYLYGREIAKQVPGYDDWLHNIEMPFQRVIGLMEYHGMAWDTNLAGVKQEEAAIMQQQAADRIKQLAKDTFDIDVNPGKSGKTNEVKSLIFDYFKIPAAKRSDKTEDPSLDEEAIIDMRFMLENKLLAIEEEKYLAVPLPPGWETIDPETDPELSKDERQAVRIAQRPPHPHKEAALQLLTELKNIQSYSTLVSSHIIGRAKYLHPLTGRIHAGYSPWTRTARLESHDPNGQNVPRLDNDVFKIRRFYVPGRKKIMFFIDFSGFELRLMAWKSGDEVMLDIFNHDGDIHATTGAEIAGVPVDQITKKMRQDAKPANFGIAYGGTEHALQKTIKTDYGQRKTLDQCLEMVNAVKRAYRRIPEYQRNIVIEAREKGFVQTIYGYIRMLPHINSANKYARGKDERRAGNTPIQGSAADVMKKCQNAVYDETGRGTLARRLDPGADVILVHGVTDMEAQIHDEIIFEMDDDPTVVEKAGTWVKALMERPPLPDFPVKIVAEASVGYSWGDKEKLDDWLAAKK